MRRLVIIVIVMGLSLMALAVPPRRGWVESGLDTDSLTMRAPYHYSTVGVRKTYPKVPVIMVNYANMSYRVSRSDVDSMFNAKNSTYGSVSQYFKEQSMGVYEPEFDIYGPVTVSQNYSYYGKANGKSGYLVAEACGLMNDSLDFTQYDTDGDGLVDLVYVLYAGPPASDMPTWIPNSGSTLVWPHYWTISAAGHGSWPIQFDGKTIEGFEVSSELDGYYSDDTTTVMAGIGLACHEFGHGMGLPDVYNTVTSSHKTSSGWDVMDLGCYNNDVMSPPCYTAYERMWMGWSVPRVLNDSENVRLGALSSTNETVVITGSGVFTNVLNPTPNEFYTLENRQNTGLWDTYLKGHGLIITKITYNAQVWAQNKVNVNAGNLGIDLQEADGWAPTFSENYGIWYEGKPGDAFPEGATNFTPYSQYPITNIEEDEDGVITFKFMGGRMPTGLETDAEADGMQPLKKAENGCLVIIRDGKKYDVLGNQINQ